MKNNLRRQLVMLSKRLLYVFLIQLFLCTVILANTGIAQRKTIEDIKVSLNIKEKTLLQFFKQVESKTDFRFTYNNDLVDLKQKVTVVGNNRTLYKILESVSIQTKLNFVQVNENIHVKSEGSLNSQNAVEIAEVQDVAVNGTVTDAKGEPLPGVTVSVSGTTIGTATDLDGKYTLSVPEGSTLVFSFIGFETQSIAVGDRRVIDVTLSEDMASLDEVVVVGYGTVERKDITGSIGSIGAKDLQEVNVTNVETALLGKVAGVQVKPRTGAPGEPAQITIRGIGSITAGSTPLYIVDGFPVADLQALNPNNIESMDVLKDASATAIYGSRGSNGVVIISTKRGQAGKTQITLDVSRGVQKVTQTPDYMNAMEQAQYSYWAAYFRNIDDGNDTSGPPETWNFGVPQTVLDVIDGRNTTDVNWIDEVLRVAPVSRYHLSTSGGNEDVKFALSGEYVDQEGIVINTDFKRFSLQANIDGQLTKRLAVKMSLNPFYTVSTGPDPRGAVYGTSILGNAATISGFVPVYDENGDYFPIIGLAEAGNFPNPVALANEIIDTSKRGGVMGNINTQYTILDELTFNVLLGGRYTATRDMRFEPHLPSLINSNPFGSDNSSMTYNWVIENTLNYTKSFGNHNIAGLVGFTTQKERGESNFLSSVRFPNNLLPTLSAASLITDGSSDIYEWSLISYLGRLNYNFDSKYYLTASIRTDGSSRFGVNNKYGIFPSAALAWRISEENFLNDVSFINDMKLRASYGQTGNNNIGNYESLATINNINYPWGNSPVGGFVQSSLSNPNLTWEKQQSFNGGLDISVLNGRLNLSVDHFRSKNTDLLLYVNVPTITGFGTALQNIGAVENTGWEFVVSTVNTTGKFAWSTDFNISFNKNKVVNLGSQGDPIISTVNLNEGIGHITMIGQPIGMFYGLVYDGIFETSEELAEGPLYNPGARNGTRLGDAKFVDYSGPEGVPDGLINSYDRVVIGSPYPDFYYGMTNRFSYQNFILSFSFHGVNGNKIGSEARRLGLRSEFRVQQLALANNFWISEEQQGDSNTPRPNDEPTGGIREFSTRHLDDGSYLRINNISLSYALPADIIQKLKLNSLRVYVNATNPFIFTNYIGYNPDVNNSDNALTPGVDSNNYPLPKTLSLGLTLGF